MKINSKLNIYIVKVREKKSQALCFIIIDLILGHIQTMNHTLMVCERFESGSFVYVEKNLLKGRKSKFVLLLL